MFKNARLRLLMTLAGFERLGIDDEPDATWIIPSALTARQLHETHDVIQKHGENPVLEYGDDDPIRAEDMLRRKPMEKARRAAYDDDESGDGGIPDNDDDLFFPGGGPTNTGPRTAAAALEQLKKKRRIRRRKSIDSDDEDDGMRGLDDETRERRRMAREAADLEKRRKIKSEEFVFSSDEDEEADREFFAREETRRHGHAKKVMEVLREGMVGQTGKRKSDRGGEEAGEGRRKKQRVSEDESEDEADVLMAEGSSSPRIHELEDESEMEDEETPLSSPPMRDVFNGDALKELPINVRKPEGSTAATKALQPASTDTDEEDEDDAPIMVQPRRRNNRATLLFESESE